MGNINSLADIIRVHGADRADRPALIQDERTLTWAELAARSAQVAQGLAADGVGSQDRVAFIDKNGIEHFEVFFGAALLNAVCVDVNWRLAPPEVEYIVNDADAKVLVVGPDFVPIVDAIRDNLTTVTRILVIGGHDGYESYEDWVASFPADGSGRDVGERRRRLPALLVGHHRAPEGRDAHQRQLLQPAAAGEGDVGTQPGRGQPDRDAAVPHRRRRLGGRRDVRGLPRR